MGMMFPKSITQPITLYVLAVNPHNLTEITSFRIPLDGAFWNEFSVDTLQSTGSQIAVTARITLPVYSVYNGNKEKGIAGADYLPPAQWYRTPIAELHKYFTLDRGMVGFQPQPQAFTRVVKGICDFEFEWSNMQGMALQMTEFQRQVPEAMQPREINANIFGSVGKFVQGKPNKAHFITFVC